MAAIWSRPRCVNTVSALLISTGSALEESIEGHRLTNDIDKGIRLFRHPTTSVYVQDKACGINAKMLNMNSFSMIKTDIHFGCRFEPQTRAMAKPFTP